MILESQAYEISVIYGAKVHSLVLMNNHFHLLLTSPGNDLGIVMKHFMQSLTRFINLETGRSGRVFGGKYFRTLIESPTYFAHAYKYVYRNPVRAGLCANVEAYPWSTLFGLLGKASLRVPIHYRLNETGYWHFPAEPHEQLPWLNHAPDPKHEALVQSGLRRTRFAAYNPTLVKRYLPLEAAF